MNYQPPLGILAVAPGMKEAQDGEQIEVFIPRTPDDLDLKTLSDRFTVATIVTCGVHHSEDPETDIPLNDIISAYLMPEIQRRIKSGQDKTLLLPIRQALVVFPPPDEPQYYRVYLNDEVEIIGKIHLKYGVVNKGDPILANEVYDVYSLDFVSVRDNVDGFIWLRYESPGYATYFNLVPCHKTLGVSEEILQELSEIVKEAMAWNWFRSFFGNPFDQPKSIRDRMAAEGWFPSPVILPKPWISMTEAFAQSNMRKVNDLAIKAVNEENLKLMIENWRQEEPFKSEIGFLELGINHYLNGDYISSVSVLLPRIEGIINKSLKISGLNAKRRIADAFGVIDRVCIGPTQDRWIGKNLRERLKESIDEFFNAKFDPNDPNAAFNLGRHAHAHGATEASLYDQIYALKIILTIDCLFFVLRR